VKNPELCWRDATALCGADMQHIIEKIALHSWFAGMLIVAFVLSMAGYWARIRRDERRRRGAKHENRESNAERMRLTGQ